MKIEKRLTILISIFLLTISLLPGCRNKTEITTDEIKPYKMDSLELNELPSTMSVAQFKKFLELDPAKDIRCKLPTESEFADIADKLGGFKKSYSVPVAANDTAPHFYSGFPAPEYEVYASASTVQIERADLVGISDNIALYLSNKYGLFIVSVDSANPENTMVSCAMALPGNPKNFYIKNGSVIALINYTDTYFPDQKINAAVMKFKISGKELLYNSGILLEEQKILDTRLFNETLAVFSEESKIYNDTKNYFLTTIATKAALAETNKDVLINTTEYPDDENIQWIETSFMPFISASDTHLILNKFRTVSQYSYTKKYNYNICTEYKDITKEYCSTKWKKIPNPDYVQYKGSIKCSKGLLDCLNTVGASLSKYIYVPDGQECKTHTNKECVSWETKYGEYPVYEQIEETELIVYNFEDDQLVKLDGTMAQVEDDTINTSETELKIAGKINEHNHIYSQNGFLYTLNSKGTLDTFAIIDNSIVKTDELQCTTNGYTVTAARFSDKVLVFNQAEYWSNQMFDSSNIHLVSLEDPAKPQYDTSINLPGLLENFIIANDTILSFGSVNIAETNGSKKEYYAFGKISTFSLEDMKEIDNILLGLDYTNSYSITSQDDQAYFFDSNFNRLFLPFVSSGFVEGAGYESKNRVSITNLSNSALNDEGILEFPTSIERVIGLNKDTALAFSPSHIFQLSKGTDWTKDKIISITIPTEAYRIPDSEIWVSIYNDDGQTTINTAPSTEVFTKQPLDSVIIINATSHACKTQQIYFTDNKIIVVFEKEGKFSTSEDCPENINESFDDLNFVGWEVSSSGILNSISEEDVKTIYNKILNPIYCVIDINNYSGEELYDLEELPESYECFSEEEFYEKSNNQNIE